MTDILEKSRNELVKWWGISEYMEYIGTHLKQRELNRIYFLYKSQQASCRPSLVMWVKELGITWKMDRTCIHLAVYLLDIFMDNHNITTHCLYLVTLVCLLLAAKFDERELNTPKVADLNNLVTNPYPLSDFHAMEIKILKMCNWTLSIPTAAHFADFYGLYVISNDDLQYNKKYTSLRALWLDAIQNINTFLDIVLREVQLMQGQPSIVASAIMAATRSTMNIFPIWTAELGKITEYNFLDVEYTRDLLLEKLHSQSSTDILRRTHIYKRKQCLNVTESETTKRLKL